MGTEAIYPPGTKLTRKDPQGNNQDRMVVTGAGARVIAESLIEFGSPVELDIRIVREEYDADIPEGVRLQQPSFVDPGPTVEQIFAAQERKVELESGVKPERGSRMSKAAARKAKEAQVPTPPNEQVPDAKELEDLS